MIVYVDESGDLGFGRKRGASKYLVITLLFVEGSRIMRYLMRKAREDLKIPKRVEIKGQNLFPNQRKEMLRRLRDHKFPIYSIVVKKANVYARSSREPDRFYNFIVKEILQQAVSELNITEANHLAMVADNKARRKFQGLGFIPYLERQFEDIGLRVHTEDSKKAGGLGAVDVVSHAIQRCFERNDLSYLSIIRNRVRINRYLFTGKTKSGA